MTRPLQPRQRLGAKGLLDDVERLRRRFWRGWAASPRPAPSRHRRFSGGFAGVPWRLSGRHLHGDAVERKVSPLRLSRPAGGCGLRSRPPARPLGGSVARLLDLELIVEHRLAERRRRLQSRHFEQHAVGTAEFRLDEAARIGGRIEEIAGRPAARAKSEAIERNEGCLRIAGHRISLVFPLVFRGRILAAKYTALRHEPEINSASGMPPRS